MELRSLSFVCKEDDFKITFDSDGVTTDEVMQHFVQFLLGIGYGRDSIHDAMKEIAEEHDNYLKCYEGHKSKLLPDLD